MTTSKTNILRQYRVRSGNPYALLTPEGIFEGLYKGKLVNSQTIALNSLGPKDFVPVKKSFYSHKEIERVIENLLFQMWQERLNIWPEETPENIKGILDPIAALKFLGFDSEYYESLGHHTLNGKEIEIAGTIDDNFKTVQISQKFDLCTRNFTAAHELGHALFHQGLSLHRDRPLNGSRQNHNPIEHQANKAASYFLMPKDFVIQAFQEKYGEIPFTRDMIFQLNESNPKLSINPYDIAENELALILAKTESYSGIAYISLAEQFSVSNEAMAYRILELGLIDLS